MSSGPIPEGRRAVPPGLTPASTTPPGPPPGLRPLSESRSTSGEPTPPPDHMKLRPSPADVARPIHATDIDHAQVRRNREAEEEAERQQRQYERAVRRVHSNLGAQASHVAPGSGPQVQMDWIAHRSREVGIPTPAEVDARQIGRATAEELNTVEALATSFERGAGSTVVAGLRAAGDKFGLEENATGYYRALDALDEANYATNGVSVVGSLAGHMADPVWLGTFGAGRVLQLGKLAGNTARAGRWGVQASDAAVAGAVADLARGVVRGDDSGQIKEDMALGAVLGIGLDSAMARAGALRANLPDVPSYAPIRRMYPADEKLAEDTLIGRLRSMMRRQLTSAGGFPEDIFTHKVANTGRIEATINESAFTLREYERAARQVYGGVSRMTPDQTRMIDDALKGAVPVRLLPERMQPVITRMRTHVDALSRELIRIGAVEGDMVATVGGNIGEYLTRSFRIFDDPKWARRIPEDIRNRAKAWLRREYPGRSDDQLHGLMDRLLYPQANGPLAFLDSGRLGRKDLSILTRRRELPAELRALWGEYHDPMVNYSRSVERMAFLVGNHRFLQEARESGIGRYFHDKPTRQDGVSYSVRIADDASRTMAPLNGLYTSKEIAQAFADTFEQNMLPTWLRHYMKVNGAVKYSKTVLSVMTHLRNLSGNIGFAVANGHWRAYHANPAFRATWANLRKLDDAQWRDYYLGLQRLGVVGDSAHAGELRDVLRDAAGRDMNTLTGNLAERAARRGARAVEGAYQAEDDVWKIYAFENELSRYRQALPDLSEDQLRRRVADIVRDTYPTYSMVPRAVKGLRRSPLVGSFTSFPSEVVRTGYHTIKLAAEELRDPALRGIGAQRLAGILAAAGGTTGIGVASRFITGTGRDDEDDLRRFVAPWSANSQYLHLGEDEDGNRRFVDLGYVDPHSYLKNPIMALLRGEDWEQAVIDAGIEALEPFLGEEILLGRLLDVSRNAKPNGARVYNPEADTLDRWADITEHLWDSVEPGTITSAERIHAGLTGEVNQYGRDYDAPTEALATMTGQRITTINVGESLSFKARNTARRINDVSRVFNSVLTNRGRVDEAELREAATEAERDRQRIFTELHEDVQAAIRLGVPDDEVRDILSNAGLSQRNVYAVMSGDLPAFDPSTRAIESAIDRDRLLETDDPQLRRLEERLDWLRAIKEDAHSE